jgi:hypothetical protein
VIQELQHFFVVVQYVHSLARLASSRSANAGIVTVISFPCCCTPPANKQTNPQNRHEHLAARPSLMTQIAFVAAVAS